MPARKLTRSEMDPLLFGSIILGGGGGGSLAGGRATVEEAFRIGDPMIVPVDEMTDDTETVLTTSAVGAPAAVDQFVKAEDYNRIIELMQQHTETEIAAFITNEMGGGSTFNAFIQSATTGIPMLDAACNGRAHPLGTMGSMGLSEKPHYETVQTAVGGDPQKQQYLEMTVRGSVQKTSALIRQAAVQAGGLVVVARNPVTMAYIKEHAAIGAISRAAEVGRAYLSGGTPKEKIRQAVSFLKGDIVCEGQIEEFRLETQNGLDVGWFTIRHRQAVYKTYIWNEYMAMEKDGQRVSTFPDLIMTFDAESGMPVTSAEIKKGQRLVIVNVPCSELLLGAGMYERTGYEAIESILGIDILNHISIL